MYTHSRVASVQVIKPLHAWVLSMITDPIISTEDTKQDFKNFEARFGRSLASVSFLADHLSRVQQAGTVQDLRALITKDTTISQRKQWFHALNSDIGVRIRE